MDGLGSVSELTRQKTARQANSSDTRIKKYTYDVYGLPTIMSSTGTVRTVSSYNNTYMFTGREYDTETGLYYYRARYYDPSLGRFLETDPIGYGGGINLYGYVLNNPWNLVDPMGLAAEKNGWVWQKDLAKIDGKIKTIWYIAEKSIIGLQNALTETFFEEVPYQFYYSDTATYLSYLGDAFEEVYQDHADFYFSLGYRTEQLGNKILNLK